MFHDLSMVPRAGFWRRTSASMLDALLAGVLIAIAGSFLYAISGGHIQMAPFAITITSCEPTSTVPDGLSPAPPERSNYAKTCIAGFVPGLPMIRSLIVGRETKSPGKTETVSRGYLITSDGAMNAVYDLSWIEWLGFIAYLAVALHRTGKTVGMRLLGIHMVVSNDPSRTGIPLRLLAVRLAVMVAGFLPSIILLALVFKMMLDQEGGAWVGLTVLAIALGSAWALWNAILAARKRDPIYDRAAGLAVLRAADA